jgi:ribonucleoside-diphosphate reductase alpha chain
MKFNKNVQSGKRMLSASKFYMGYSRWNDQKSAYETWEESVHRVMEMHRDKFAHLMTPELEAFILKAEQAYTGKAVLGAQRALQFGGAQLRKHEARMYNCSSSHVDRPAFFQEAMYLLLCGCGVGFSVQKHHIAKLPTLKKRESTAAKTFQVPDSIEGWADAFGVLLSSYFGVTGTFPEYAGRPVHFDFSKVRPKGSLISGGFKAPGPDGLRNALNKCEALLERALAGQDEVAVTPIVAYDFTMHMSDAVLSGGVRRSATICLFDKDDEAMLNAKTGNWFEENPQRGRSNNSVVLVRDELTRGEWAKIMEAVRDFGEPGFIFTSNKEFTYNPCVEIGMYPVCVETGESGFQFCNLVEINGGLCVDVEAFYRACEAGAILGTLQAGYTDFTYLSDATRRITEREALIGVSITGWTNNPHVLFDEEVLHRGAQIVNETNRKVARLLGINAAARTTCTKPSGNASVILGTASGIHGEHAPQYFRNVQMNEDDEVAKLIMGINPKMVERSVWNPNGTDVVVSFPVVSKEGSIYKKDLMGVKQLELVKKAQQHWVEYGTNVDLCVDPNLRHNVSNTIPVDDWDEVEQYIFDNRQWFAGISLLPAAGDKIYPQAPFTEVHTAEEVVEMYGEASTFALGLIAEGLHLFNNDLWKACSVAMSVKEPLGEGEADVPENEWVHSFLKFAATFFDGDLEKTSFCLKDCYNLQKWAEIVDSMQEIDFSTLLNEQKYVDADTLASQACAGGVCEISFA